MASEARCLYSGQNKSTVPKRKEKRLVRKGQLNRDTRRDDEKGSVESTHKVFSPSCTETAV